MVGVLSMIPVLGDRATLVSDQHSGPVPVAVMAEESLEEKRDVVGRKIGVGRSIGVYFVC